jgi:Tol biopolymer transport system component
MSKLVNSIVLLLAVASFMLVNSSCKKQSVVEPNFPTFPSLADLVPFSNLGQGKLVFERIGPSNNNYSGVYVVDIDQQRSWGISGTVIYGPTVSPDGQMIIYTSSTSAPTYFDVYVMNSDGSNRQRVSDIVGQEQSPSWTSDGTQILFLATRFSTSIPALYRQSPVPNPSNQVLLIDFGGINPPSVYIPEGPVSASSTGKLVLSAAGIRTFDSDGSNMTLIIPQQSNSQRFYSPAWSPDGQNIAVLSMLRDSSFNILSIAVLLFASDGTHPDTLISLSASGTTDYVGDNSYSLCWSPDGSQIAFTRPDGQAVGSHIYLIKKDHTGFTQVTFATDVTDRSLSWSH